MAIVPKRIVKRIAFYSTRIDRIEMNAETLGLTADIVETFQQQVEAAKAAYRRQQTAQMEARTATAALNNAVKAMNSAGAAIIAHVRTKARANDDPSLYHLALLPPIAKKSEIEAPGTPSALQIELDAIGQLTLTWKCKNPRRARGTIYYIYRSVGRNGVKESIGTSGTRRFVDKTIPMGATHLVYEIYARRSTRQGAAATFLVSFGSNLSAERIVRGPNHQTRRAA